MANDVAVLNPFQTKKPERIMPLGGIIGGFDNFENDLRDVELDPDKAKPIPIASEGSMSGFNQQPTQERTDVNQAEDTAQGGWERSFSPATSQVAGEAVSFIHNVFSEVPGIMGDVAAGIGKDLIINQIIGLGGESKPETSKPLTPEQVKIKADAREVIQHRDRIENAVRQNNQLQEVSLLNEERRITGGVDTTEKTDKKSAHSFFWSLNEKIQKMLHIKKQEEGPIVSPAKKGYALEKAFEGGSGSQGGGQSNLSFQATG